MDADAAAPTGDANLPPPPPAENADPTKPSTITITFKDSRQFEQSFKLKVTTKISKAMDAFSAKIERDVASLRFLFDGERLAGGSTVEELDLNDGDIVDVFEEQIGGGEDGEQG